MSVFEDATVIVCLALMLGLSACKNSSSTTLIPEGVGNEDTDADTVIVPPSDAPGDLDGDTTPQSFVQHLTNSGDVARTGWYPNQPGLSPAIVGGSTFGRRFDMTLPGGGPSLAYAGADHVYAQPLYFGGRVLVATEANNVYSLDAETGEILASKNLGEPWAASDLACGDLVPFVGITGTPVIDAESGVAYLLAKTYDPSSRDPAYVAHALDAMTLAERPGFPLEIKGTADNDARFAFNASVQLQRPGLLLLDGVIYAAFGGHCDLAFYNGWIVGFTPQGSIASMWVAESGPDAERGCGIWQSGAGLVSDGPGRMLVTTGNSWSSPVHLPTAGATPPGTLGQAVIRLGVQPNHTLVAQDFFIPYDVRVLDDTDADFGSGAAVALPAPFSTAAHPHLATTVGKAGVLYVLDRDNLGGFKQGLNGDDAVLSRLNLPRGAWSRPGVWPGDGGFIYLVLSYAPLQALQYAVDGAGLPAFAVVGQSAVELGHTSGSAIVTSQGTTSGTALVWTVATTGAFGDGELRAYDPLPDENGTLSLRYADAIGPATKFFSPGVGVGRLYVGTRNGHVIAYGAPSTSPVTSSGLDFGTVVVGQSSAKIVAVRANVALTITAVATYGDFTANAAGLALPRTLAVGESVDIGATFAPSSSSLAVAALELTTSAGDAAVSLRGTGQSPTPKLVLSSPFASFGGVTIGDTRTVNVIARNVGAQPLTFGGITFPSAPFFADNTPASGSTLAAGASVTFTLRFHPTAAGSWGSSITIGSDGGSKTITMSGSAAAPGYMSITPSDLQVPFGQVQVGTTATQSFTVTNTGGTYIVIAKSKPPSVNGFSALDSLDEGVRLDPGTFRTLRVQFAPTLAGSTSASWVITATDGTGVHDVVFTGDGVP